MKNALLNIFVVLTVKKSNFFYSIVLIQYVKIKK